ncbi:MAG: glycine cleavage system aminomethyltransferase GcvT [Bacteroidales bacterium]|nr:glycine cleavage system aminomethyltransferase GcvT [Bacteroidales bacterium]MDD6731389.1 glycine cleavage system aminomethyltransferase GcvT [Bacteroidales bacterium]MDY4558474.1 glycine cleavage system aminomethyltransferase GcvT [Alloprevotella sp.]
MSEKRTCLYDRHVALGAKMVPFGGFEMPIQYTDITDEHQAVRNACGVFDVSHMGEVLVTGPEAERYVQHIFTNDVAGAPVGKIFYGMMLHPHGGTVDDLLVYKMGDEKFFLVINAANIDKDYAWITEQAKDFDVQTENQSEYYGQLAVQGPEAERVVEEVLGLTCKELEFYTFKLIETPQETLIVSRTGYTGEDGFEIYGSHAYIQQAWDKLIDSKQAKPCGLGCRDTLRFEVGLPLYGDELTDDISPIMAGLGMFVKLDKEEFVGKEAVARQKAEGVAKKLVGIELEGKAIPRHGYEVVVEDKVIGEVTTGYCSISTGKSVCMALIDAAYAKLDTPVQVRIHRKLQPGKVVKKRFYQKHYKK